MWQQWINFILGLWVILSVFIFTGAVLMLVVGVTGMVMAGLAVWGALEYQTQEMKELYHQHHQHA